MTRLVDSTMKRKRARTSTSVVATADAAADSERTSPGTIATVVILLLSSSTLLLPGASALALGTNPSPAPSPTHTLLLCRHGDSIWNGGHPGHLETFTGWTDVPLSPKGYDEASRTAAQLASSYPFGIDACFTSVLGRATLTAHHCLWAYGSSPPAVQVARYVSDYRLNERHYGALQGYVKSDVEAGLHGHDPRTVEGWRRSWHAVPPLLDRDDPRRAEEVRRFGGCCGGAENVPRGESLEMVARDRIAPFLDEVLTPTLDGAAKERKRNGSDDGGEEEGGTGLVVAHANSLRALIGVICEVERDGNILSRLERMKIQTGVPLVLRYRRRGCEGANGKGRYEVCDLPGLVRSSGGGTEINEGDSLVNGNIDVPRRPASDLPVWPLASIPWSGSGRARSRKFARAKEKSIEFDVL